jgi:hypothetical protein
MAEPWADSRRSLGVGPDSRRELTLISLVGIGMSLHLVSIESVMWTATSMCCD